MVVVVVVVVVQRLLLLLLLLLGPPASLLYHVLLRMCGWAAEAAVALRCFLAKPGASQPTPHPTPHLQILPLQVAGLWILLAAGVAAAAAALLVRWLLRRGVRRAKRAAVVQRSLTKLHAMGSSSSFQRLRRLASGHRADSGKLGCDGSDCSQPDGCGDGKLAECDVEQALGRSDSSAAGAEGDCREAVAAAVAELLATAARVQRLMGQPPAKQA